MDISAEVRAECARQRISTRTLAQQANIPYSTMHRRLFANDNSWRLDDLQRVTTVLGLNVIELLCRANERCAA